jgi:hypothetical protein
MYVLHVSKLVDYLRVAHPNLAAVWEKRIDPLVKKASDTQLPDGRSKLGNLYTPRIVSYLNSAANQIDVVRNALARIVEGISVAGQFKESEPKPRGRKRDDREPLREWIAGRNFQLPGMKSKRELAKIISRELETVRPKGVPLVGWSAVERVLERKETGIRWSQNQSKHSAKVRWPHLPHK